MEEKYLGQIELKVRKYDDLNQKEAGDVGPAFREDRPFDAGIERVIPIVAIGCLIGVDNRRRLFRLLPVVSFHFFGMTRS